jgi:hypothetical protein
MKFCRECGKQNNDKSLFCIACGTPFMKPEVQPEIKPEAAEEVPQVAVQDVSSPSVEEYFPSNDGFESIASADAEPVYYDEYVEPAAEEAAPEQPVYEEQPVYQEYTEPVAEEAAAEQAVYEERPVYQE